MEEVEGVVRTLAFRRCQGEMAQVFGIGDATSETELLQAQQWVVAAPVFNPRYVGERKRWSIQVSV